MQHRSGHQKILRASYRCYDAVSSSGEKIVHPKTIFINFKDIIYPPDHQSKLQLVDAVVVSAAMTIRNRNYGCHQAVLSRYYGTLFPGIDSGSFEK